MVWKKLLGHLTTHDLKKLAVVLASAAFRRNSFSIRIDNQRLLSSFLKLLQKYKNGNLSERRIKYSCILPK